MISFFEFLDFAGTIAFAISGALTAIKKKMDPFGIFIISFVTAVGGGTIRDILIGQTPVSWMINLETFYLIVLSVILTIIIRKHISFLRTSLFLFDTIGLGIFTIIGVEKGIDQNLDPIICIILATMTGSFGGVIRDILCNEIPVIFKKEVYATASILGGIVFLIFHHFNFDSNWTYVFTIMMVIIVRLIAVRFKITLPNFYNR